MQLANIKTKLAKPALAWTQALVLASAGLLPMLNAANVSAAQLIDRSLAATTSVGDAVSTHLYDFTVVGDTSTVQSLSFVYCTAAIGTCTAPTGMNLSTDTLAIDSDTGTETGWGALTAVGANELQVDRTDAVDVTVNSDIVIGFSGVTNPTLSAPTTSFYVRITSYTDTAHTSTRDEGTVAGAVTQQLTITGRVSERLEFCVAALTAAVAVPNDCSGFPTTTNVDIGVIDDDATPSRSPEPIDGVNPALGGNNKYGAAMVDTNAGGGASISYFVEADDTGTNQLRNFRIDDATTCNASEATFTDPCFQSAATTGTDLTAATGERFGMHVSCAEPSPTSQTDVLVTVASDYNADGVDTTCSDIDTETDGTFAWNNTGNAVELANSGGAIVNDELIQLAFAAKAAATTPTGSYTVTTTYVATATF